jgi:hypothetical protein
MYDEAHKNNNNNNTTPIFIGLNKTTQKHGRREKKTTQEEIKSYVPKQTYFRYYRVLTMVYNTQRY